MNKVSVLLLGVVFVFSSLLFFGCSNEKEQNKNISLNESIMEKHKKDMQKKQERQGALPLSENENATREKQLVSAEACQQKFEKCVARCNNDSCEEWCLEYLASCEKDLPRDLQTLKR